MADICLDFVQHNQPSFFVHFAYANVSKELIYRTLEELDLGIIAEVSLKPALNKKNENGNSVVVHFDKWFRNSTADKVRRKLISGDSIKINYSPTAYLQVIAFQPKVKSTQPVSSTRPTITFNDEEFRTPPRTIAKSDECRAPMKKSRRPMTPPMSPPRERERKSREPREPREPREQHKEHKEQHRQPKYNKQHDNILPDVFDRNANESSSGVLLPTKKHRKPIKFIDDESDTDDDYKNITNKTQPQPQPQPNNPHTETESDILYGDL